MGLLAAPAINPNVAEFEQLLAEHDITFEYADNYERFCRGRENWVQIQLVAKRLPAGEAVRRYNAMIDRRIGRQYRAEYYRREI